MRSATAALVLTLPLAFAACGGSDDDTSAAATAGAAGTATAGSTTAGKAGATAGKAGSGGTATAGKAGASGTATAGSSTAGSSTAGSSTAGSSTAGSATAGSGTAGSGGGCAMNGTPPLGTIPGALTTPNPTLRHATIEWLIQGDQNENATVAVRFRKQGDATFRDGMPLRRTPAGTLEGFSWPNRFSGSLFDLDPGTTYDVEVTLTDPDGGCETRTTTITTRTVPQAMAGAPVKPATPGTFNQIANGAEPGDVVELDAGNYPGFSWSKDGQPQKPIVIRGKAGAAVVIQGDVSLISRKDVHLENVTVEGRVRINDTARVSVTRNTVNAKTDGIVAGLRSEDDYIAHNVVHGATTWKESALGASGDNVGEGILVTGPGHVIEHNEVRGFRDCISFLEDGEAVDQHSIDVLENDLTLCADDAIEADFCFHDCRIVRNRMADVFMAMSSQPGLGGPTYFVRNVAFDVVHQGFKLQRGSIGDVMLHNTIVKSGDAFSVFTTDVFSRQLSRNNLFLGGPGGDHNGYDSGPGNVIQLAAADPSGDYDYDGLGTLSAQFKGQIGSVKFASFAELVSKTTEKHAVVVSLGAFASSITYPAQPFPEKGHVDLRLAPGGAAIDVGVVIPNVNDGYAGGAPDLGALELGAPLPAWGPQ